MTHWWHDARMRLARWLAPAPLPPEADPETPPNIAYLQRKQLEVARELERYDPRIIEMLRTQARLAQHFRDERERLRRETG
jgi:hypothetical protein